MGFEKLEWGRQRKRGGILIGGGEGVGKSGSRQLGTNAKNFKNSQNLKKSQKSV